MDSALQIIEEYSRTGSSLREEFFRLNGEKIRKAAFNTAISLARGGKLLLCGNGGSAADAQHVAGEFVNRFLLDRPALPAIALTTDTSVLSAIANDSAYEDVFSRQVEALGAPGDVLLGISTSGKSHNVIRAFACASEKGLYTIGLCGNNSSLMHCDIIIDVSSDRTPLIQEMHLAAEHMFCYLCDYYLFENVGEIRPFLANPERQVNNADI